MASFSNTDTLPVPPSGLSSRRLTNRPLPLLTLPSNDSLLTTKSDNDDEPELITPAMQHFPLVCPPAPGGPSSPAASPNPLRQLHHPLPTIILPDLSPEPDTLTSSPQDDMKAQPVTTSFSARARVNMVYPPNKRAATYSHAQAAHRVSPKSMAAASVSKRRTVEIPSRNHLRSSTPPPSLPPSRVSQHAHQRALAAQRASEYQRRMVARTSHLSSLDRGIRLLLEEEYREDVKNWMLEKEDKTMASASAMDQQPELQWHMRGHLLDFLLEIHLHFRLRPETLYLTLSILDRYVSRRIVYKKHYQLVGCVALWLASKFEDAKDRVPSVKDLKELCNHAYEESAFVQMEGHVLTTVDWDLGHPTCESWLRVLSTETYGLTLSGGEGLFGGHGALNTTEQTPFEEIRIQHVARFLMEVTLYYREYIQYPPSILACASLNLARHICGKPRRMADESAIVLHVISALDYTLSQNLDSISQTLVKKYSYAYYAKASGIVVAFYLRGGRYPVAKPTVEKPECLVTHSVPLEALREAARLPQPPVTPIRERMEVRWGSGRTDIEETPGLIRSDSSSSVMDIEDADDEDVSVRSFSQPREFESDISADEDEDVAIHDDEDPDSEFEMETNPVYLHFPSSSGSMLNVPPSEDVVPGIDSLPITPTTPMFQLDPFGNTQQQAIHAGQQQHVPHLHCKNKENVGPDGVRAHHTRTNSNASIPCLPANVGNGVVVESGEEYAGEYRPALSAIMP